MTKSLALFVFTLFMAFSISKPVVAQSLKSGFQALEAHDYFKAKRVFEKRKKRQKALASYGLARLYKRELNVFHNIDSAHINIQTALELFETVKPRQKKKFAAYGFEQSNLERIRQEISSKIFERTVSENTEEAFDTFIKQHIWAEEIPQATFFRDSLAFEKHYADAFSMEMAIFLEKYPTSVFADRAQEAFYKFQFEEETIGKRREDYENFIINFPENPFTKEADRALFRFAEEVNTTASYEKFLQSYPKSAFRSEAWRLLYRSYIKQNGLALINSFKKQFPDYPFMAELDRELALLNTQLFPVYTNLKWGFMDTDGKIQIPAKFDYVELFSQGRAAAQSDDLYGFIDVVGNWIIRPQFLDVTPFRFNLSVVINEQNKAGVINLFGEWIIEPAFEDIQIINDDWLWIEDESGWIIYQISKNQFGKEHFTSVSEFVNGFALVALEKEYALIDYSGNRLLSFSEEIERFGDLFLVQWNDSTALVNDFNEQILPYNEYLFGTYNPRGLTPFELDDLLGYINAEGKIIIPNKLDPYPNWEFFAGFVNQHAKAFQARSKKIGLIDTTGHWVLAPKYNDVSFFSNKIAVQMNDKWEFVNNNGQRLNIGVFDRAESFVDSAAIVVKAGLFGLIDKEGKELIPLQMKRLFRFSDDLLRWEDEEGQLWLGDNHGNLIFSEAADKIDRIDDHTIRLIANENVFYYLTRERRLIGLK